MDTILQIDNLIKYYPDFTLDDLSLSVPKGTIVGLIGENGAGKTTTINLILNAVEKDSGSIKVFGKDHLTYEKEIKQQIGVVPDECNLPQMFTAADIDVVMKRIYCAWEHEQYLECLQKFDLPLNQQIGSFSKGMKIKMNLAIALSHKPKLLILDEATSGLDPVMRDDLLDILLDFVQNEENGVLFSSHITTDLEKVADYVAFLHQGKLLFCKEKDELIYHYGLVHCGEKDFFRMERQDILAWRKQDYEYQALVADREAAGRKYKGYVIDPATIDEIMLLYIRGENE